MKKHSVEKVEFDLNPDRWVGFGQEKRVKNQRFLVEIEHEILGSS